MLGRERDHMKDVSWSNESNDQGLNLDLASKDTYGVWSLNSIRIVGTEDVVVKLLQSVFHNHFHT